LSSRCSDRRDAPSRTIVTVPSPAVRAQKQKNYPDPKPHSMIFADDGEMHTRRPPSARRNPTKPKNNTSALLSPNTRASIPPSSAEANCYFCLFSSELGTESNEEGRPPRAHPCVPETSSQNHLSQTGGASRTHKTREGAAPGRGTVSKKTGEKCTDSRQPKRSLKSSIWPTPPNLRRPRRNLLYRFGAGFSRALTQRVNKPGPSCPGTNAADPAESGCGVIDGPSRADLRVRQLAIYHRGVPLLVATCPPSRVYEKPFAATVGRRFLNGAEKNGKRDAYSFAALTEGINWSLRDLGPYGAVRGPGSTK